MHSILLSLRARFWEKIIRKEKIFELRKTVPFHGKGVFFAHIYETQNEGGRGAVVGMIAFDFVADASTLELNESNTGLLPIQLEDYLGTPPRGYAWHIRAFEIFPKPRPLSDYGISHAPQSWQYLKARD